MSDPFSRANSGVKITDYKDRLILFTPTEHVTDIDTKYGKTDAVDADIVILDGPDAPEELDNVRIFQGVLIQRLKGCIGNSRRPMYLGRLTTIPNKKDPEGKPTWILDAPSDTDAQVARDFLARKNEDPFA